MPNLSRGKLVTLRGGQGRTLWHKTGMYQYLFVARPDGKFGSEACRSACHIERAEQNDLYGVL